MFLDGRGPLLRQAEGRSMSHTLNPYPGTEGDYLLLDKSVKLWHRYDIGDIYVLRLQSPPLLHSPSCSFLCLSPYWAKN